MATLGSIHAIPENNAEFKIVHNMIAKSVHREPT